MNRKSFLVGLLVAGCFVAEFILGPREASSDRSRTQRRRCSDRDPLDLIEARLIAPTIIELRRARRGVVSPRSGFFERAAVFEVRR